MKISITAIIAATLISGTALAHTCAEDVRKEEEKLVVPCSPKASDATDKCHQAILFSERARVIHDREDAKGLDFSELKESKEDQEHRSQGTDIHVFVDTGDKKAFCPDQPTQKWVHENGWAVSASENGRMTLRIYASENDGPWVQINPQNCLPIQQTGKTIKISLMGVLNVPKDEKGIIKTSINPELVNQ